MSTRYIKNGKINRRAEIVIKKDGMQIINPSEELILANGWEIYTPPIYEKTIEDYRRDKIEEIKHHDTSSEVNNFYMQGEPMWLDFEKRSRLLLRFQAETAKGNENTTLWGNGKEYKLPLSVAIQMLYDLETYASMCYDNTQQHIINVNSLTTIEEIQAYDYRSGYPEMLRFEI
jgi:hypothetical protein